MNKRRVFGIGVTLLVGMLFLMFTVKTTIAAGTYYVTPDGNDGNSCTDPSTPCATIQAAISKAAIGDTIKVSVGTYTGSDNYVAYVDKDLDLLGGWDANFEAQIGKSIVDGEGIRYDLWVVEFVTATVNSFIFQNGRHGIANMGSLSVSNCDVIIILRMITIQRVVLVTLGAY